MSHKAGRLQGGLIALVAGAAAIAVLLIGLAAGATGAQAQEAGESYGGTVDVLTENSCGGGSIVLTVGDDGASITEITLETPIAVADDGSFSESFQPIAGVDADFAGQFDGDAVTGTFGVAALTCTDVPFSAEAGVVPPTSTPAAAATATAGPALPSTGSGSAGSGDGTTLLVMLAAAAGVATLATGYALRRRA